jgi:hypothetical protein
VKDTDNENGTVEVHDALSGRIVVTPLNLDQLSNRGLMRIK